MIVSYNWLREFVDFDLSPESLAELLTMLGLEVESMDQRFSGMDDVVVAVVEEKNSHPNADKLSLCKVNNGKEVFEVVCGAQNFKAGNKVVLAQIGSVLPGNFKIKRSKIRGVESCGMLCSEKELGLADESSGILILPDDLSLGVPVFDALGFKDTIYEIGLTPNRADCLSIIGIAREIAAKLGKRINCAQHIVQEGTELISDFASVQVEDPNLCPRYTARYIRNCKIAPSPTWLVNRLTAIGMRSINNVVDVTNYVLLEYGHPLHAFDHDQLADGKIIVRRAGVDESFVTLDGQERSLQTSDLTIRDGQRAVALAGIMGGENSEISETTTNILLESAYFNPTAIRLTSKRLGLHTESSHRFERGTDISILPKALDRAASLIAELAGGVVAKGLIDEFDHKIEAPKILVRVERVNSILGTSLSLEEIRNLFNRLEFIIEVTSPGSMLVQVPTFRVDIEREIDLIEEVARLHGYDLIPVSMPKARVFSDRPPRHQRLEKQLKNLLIAQGFNELINFSFISPGAFDKLTLTSTDKRRQTIKLLNPLVEEQSVMRTTLLPGLLEATTRNVSYRLLDQRLFELRRIYLPHPDRELPEEPLFLGGILCGLRTSESWNQEKAPVDFYDAKGIVESILDGLNVPNVTFNASGSEVFYHPGKSCNIFSRGENIGSVGELHPTVQENYGITQTIYYFELNFDKLVGSSIDIATVVAPSRFPDTCRDIAMLLSDETPAEAVLDCLFGLKISELEDINIFDVYKGEHVPKGQKSLAIRIRYRSLHRTLTDDEVSSIHQRVINKLKTSLNVTLR